MSKKKDNSKRKYSVDSKKEYRFNIVMILLIVIFFVWGLLLVYGYNGYRDTSKKIDKIDNLEGKIGLFNDNYELIEDKVKKIDELKENNDNINEDIDKITKDIEDLDYKISKYGK